MKCNFIHVHLLKGFKLTLEEKLETLEPIECKQIVTNILT